MHNTTDSLYLTDAYLATFAARVIDSNADGVVLDRSAFYPGGGGQPHDTGTLVVGGATRRVIRVSRDGGRIVHALDDGPSLQAGTDVEGTVDWERRHLLMRTHTAMHILCGVIWRDHRALVTGGNMEPGRGRLDFDFPALDRDVAREVESSINAEVSAARPVRVAFLSREEAAAVPDLVRTKTNLIPPEVTRIRTVEIVGLDLQADGGTHVANTSEVGSLRIVGIKNKGKSNRRIEVELGGPPDARVTG